MSFGDNKASDWHDQSQYLEDDRRSRSISKRVKSLEKKLVGRRFNSTQIAFTFYVIAIAAKLARLGAADNIDSKTLANQVDSFKEIFSISDNELPKIEAYYSDALGDTVDAVHYAKQIVNLFPTNRLLIEELVDDLFEFSDADSPMTAEKAAFLKRIVLALNFNENYFKRMLRQHMIRYNKDPFALLVVPRNTTYVGLKKAYRLAVRDCHPDKFANNDGLPELIEIANDQFNYYTQAYEAIKTRRGFKSKAAS